MKHAGVGAMRKVSKPRYITPDKILLGDTIRVSYPETEGIKRDIVARVHTREYEGNDRVLFTKEGGQILRWNFSLRPPTITLLDRKTETPTMLDLFQDLILE